MINFKPPKWLSSLLDKSRKTLKPVLDLSERLFLLQLKIDIYICSYVFYTAPGQIFYIFSGMVYFGRSSCEDHSLFYWFLITFYVLMSELAITLFILFNFSVSKEYLKRHFDSVFIHKMLGNTMLKAIRVVALSAVGIIGSNLIERQINNNEILNKAREYRLLLSEREKTDIKFAESPLGKETIRSHNKILERASRPSLVDNVATLTDSGVRYTTVTSAIKECVTSVSSIFNGKN